MPAVRLTVAYDGTDLHGWARQPGLRTVAGELGRALGAVLGEAPALSVAGRTDTGVHAAGNVASFAGPARVPAARLAAAANGHLPPDVAVLDAAEAADGFDARADARARTYRYRLLVRPAPDPLARRFEVHHPRPVDEALLGELADLVVGRHDFRAFTPTETQHVFFERTVLAAAWSRRGDRLELRLTADAFLRHMVRVLVGTMLDARDTDGFRRLLEGAPRSAAGRTAPARGLTLESVLYAGSGTAGNAAHRPGSPPQA